MPTNHEALRTPETPDTGPRSEPGQIPVRRSPTAPDTVPALVTEPTDYRTLNNLIEVLRGHDPRHPFLEAVQRLRADNLTLLQHNVELMRERLGG